MGIIALMMHSALDFSLQLPANALTFMVLLAFGWIALFQGRRAARDEDEDEEEGAKAL